MATSDGPHPINWNHLPLSRSSVDRAAHRRSEPNLLAALREEPGTRVTLVQGGDLAVGEMGHGLHLEAATDLAYITDSAALWLFLGADDDGAHLALVLPHRRGQDRVDIEGFLQGGELIELARTHRWAPLRDIGQFLPDRDAGLGTTAVALAAWHETHRRCARCGEPTQVSEAGWMRTCSLDGSEHYPRTDPAVIMSVVDDDDRLLLGHAGHWPERRFSTLAGYVEPGEGLEAAVRREVLEETDVRIGDVRYRGSQPWPFPASLMFGFHARATSTRITVDGVEVTDARWFTRPGLQDEVGSGRVLLPMGSSIARALIEDWFGGPLNP